MMVPWLVGFVAVGIVGTVVFLLVKNNLVLVAPNQVAIFSGSKRHANGAALGYVKVRGGRRLKLPLIETVDVLDLSMPAVSVKLSGAYARGCIPMTVEGVALVRLAADEPVLSRAVERFLGRSREEIHFIASGVVGATLREVLAGLPPEEVAGDISGFARRVKARANDELQRIGLELDQLKILTASDELGYVDLVRRSPMRAAGEQAPAERANAAPHPAPAGPGALPPSDGADVAWGEAAPPWKK